MKGAFWPLLKKEIRQASSTAAVMAAVVVVWHLFLYTRIGHWPMEAVFGAGAFPLGFVPLWLLWRSFATMRQEWAGNHMHLLLALPVPGWALAASKAAAVMLEAAFFIVVIGGGAAALGFKTGLLSQIPFEDIRAPWGQLVVVGAVSLFSPLMWIVMTQFSYVAGRLVTKLSWLVSAAAFALSGWFVVRAGAVLAPLFRWVPGWPLSADIIVNGVVVKAGADLDWTPAIGTVLAVGALFWAVSTLLERDVEL